MESAVRVLRVVPWRLRAGTDPMSPPLRTESIDCLLIGWESVIMVDPWFRKFLLVTSL